MVRFWRSFRSILLPFSTREALSALGQVLDRPPLPVAAWVGPAPAQANGGIGQIVLDLEHAAISPGSEIESHAHVPGESHLLSVIRLRPRRRG